MRRLKRRGGAGEGAVVVGGGPQGHAILVLHDEDDDKGEQIFSRRGTGRWVGLVKRKLGRRVKMGWGWFGPEGKKRERGSPGRVFFFSFLF
jgi:hypothetical protein